MSEEIQKNDAKKNGEVFYVWNVIEKSRRLELRCDLNEYCFSGGWEETELD